MWLQVCLHGDSPEGCEEGEETETNESETVNNMSEQINFNGRAGMPGPQELQTFVIRDGKLVDVTYMPDPELGRPMQPKGIVIHYTASYSAKGTAQWFKDNTVDIHLIIDKDGTPIQMVPFHRTADHAGKSSWRGYDGLNSYFIGIEVVCLGPLTVTSDGFKDCYNRPYKGKYNTKEMLGLKYWEPFTEAQEASLLALVKSIIKHYNIPVENVCGHHEASPGRKFDPGGSLGMSMDAFRELVVRNL